MVRHVGRPIHDLMEVSVEVLAAIWARTRQARVQQAEQIRKLSHDRFKIIVTFHLAHAPESAHVFEGQSTFKSIEFVYLSD